VQQIDGWMKVTVIERESMAGNDRGWMDGGI
jgi:hypothetical protein